MRTLLDRNVSGKFLILVGVDFSENGQSVLQTAADLASTMPETELHLVHAFGPAVPADDLRWFPALCNFVSLEDSDAAAAALHQLATSLPIGAERVCAYVHEGSATTVITQVAEDIEADIVVIGSQDHATAKRAFFGSVAERLVRMAPCPVLIIRHNSIAEDDVIAAPCQACEASKRLTWGARLQCLDHAQYDPHFDTSPSGLFQTAMAPSISSRAAMSQRFATLPGHDQPGLRASTLM